MNSHSLRFVKDPLESVNQVFVILVTFKHVESGQNKFVFILNKFLKQLDIIWISEMVACKTVDVIDEFLLAFWKWTLWSFKVRS